MLSVKMDSKRGIAVLKPKGALSKKDFNSGDTIQNS